MQQFTIPQFIEVEDKIIGPITVRQFILLMICFIIIAIEYKLMFFIAWIIVGLVELAIFGIIAFIKINGRPFHYLILNLIQTLGKPALRIWTQTASKNGLSDNDVKDSKLSSEEMDKYAKKTPGVSRLTELSLVVDTKGGYKGEQGQKTKIYFAK